MDLKIKNSVALLALLLLASCGGGGGGGGGNGGSSQPKERSVVDGLTADTMKYFENWKMKRIKTCSLEDAFGFSDIGESSDKAGLDIEQIIVQNGNSAIFTKGPESITISDFSGMSGNSSSTTRGTDLDAKLERKGSLCTVTIEGKEVFRTQLAEQVTISNHWGDKENPKELSFELGIKQVFKPSEKSILMMSQILKLNQDEAKKFITLGTNNKIIFSETGENFWRFVSFGPRWNTKEVELRMRAPLLYDGGKVLNTKDNGTLDFLLKYDPDNQGHFESLKYIGFKNFSTEEASECMTINAGMQVDNMIGVCKILQPDIEAISYENGLMLKLTIRYFKGYRARNDENNGWKSVLVKLVNEALSKGKDVQSLDPEGKTEIIKIVANNFRLIMPKVKSSKGLVEVGDELTTLGFEWAFSNPLLDISHLDEILNVSAEFVNPFTESVRSLITVLAEEPDSISARQTLDFAKKIAEVGEYKVLASEALRLAQLRNHRTFETRYFDRILQQQVTSDQLDEWIRKFSR